MVSPVRAYGKKSITAKRIVVVAIQQSRRRRGSSSKRRGTESKMGEQGRGGETSITIPKINKKYTKYSQFDTTATAAFSSLRHRQYKKEISHPPLHK